MKKFGIVLALCLVASSTALASDYDNQTQYDFEDDLVLGDLVRPDGALVSTSRRWERVSLIKVRDHFIDRLLQSMDWL